MGKESYRISVIVPVYKVEQFIGRCTVSLMEQTMDEGVEYVFVDDASPDRSIRILEETLGRYPEKKDHVRIIRHEKNLGLPAARNSGLDVASGEYIFHCDSDDYVESDMLEQMYSKAVDDDADIVWCDWWLSFEKNERYMKQPDYDTPMDALKAMLSGVMKFNVWNKLVRRSLYTESGVLFPSGYGMGEDMTMMRLFARARKAVYLPKAFYHYVQQNSGAFSKTYSERHLMELRHNVETLSDDLRKLYGDSLEQEIAFLKLDVKFPFLISGDRSRYELWKSWYPEADKYILQNRQVSFRRMALQWMAARNQFWLVSLYYMFVHKVVYGLIYR